MQTPTTGAVGTTARPLKPEGFRYYCGLPHGCGKHFDYPSLEHGNPPCPHCGNTDTQYDPSPGK